VVNHMTNRFDERSIKGSTADTESLFLVSQAQERVSSISSSRVPTLVPALGV
jgi:hypothetical protein